MIVFNNLKNKKGGLLAVFLLTLGNAVGELLLPYFMSLIVDRGVRTGNIPLILKIGLVMILVTLFTVICRASASYFSSRTTMAFSRDLRQEFFTKVNAMTFDETEEYGISSLITRATADVSQVEQFVLMAMRPLLRAPLSFVGGLVMAFLTNARLSLVILAALPILFVALYFILNRVIPYFPKVQAALDRINLLLRQRLTGLKVIRAFSRDDYEEEIFEEANSNYYQLQKKVNQTLATLMPLLTLTVNLAVVLALFLGVRMISRGQMQVGELMAFIQYISMVTSAVILVTRMSSMIPQTAASIHRISEILERPSRQVGGQVKLEGPIRSIQARDLSFAYPGSQRPVLEKINFEVNENETLGIIGGTGSGKTTILKLLLQFYEPSSGQLLINGQDISELETKSLRAQMSYVPQQNFFFTGSVEDNLHFSNPQASRSWMLDQLDTAQALEFLPSTNPLDQEVARGGQNYSGGQRQRLAIARALTREASVYLFDDSFSALDYQTDYQVRQALQEKMGKAILIIVAQRVATIRQADKILVLDHGRVAGFGSHEDLLKSSTIYREIAISQGEEDRHD